MSNQDILQRFEELEAGRILGDLDAEEIQEWEDLSKDSRCRLDPSLELAAAAIEAEFSQDEESELPESLLTLLREDIAQFIVPEADAEPINAKSTEPILQLSAWKRVVTAPQTPWAIAALLAILLVANLFIQGKAPAPGAPAAVVATEPSSEEARDTLLASTENLVQLDFDGTERYGKMTGKVVWSDELQEGYMTLSNLPVNDPGKKQYQLWIVDPTRDEKPVDGGVFDIPQGESTAVIRIQNPLVITDPKAFVITLEQPGGVVVSKQQDVVATTKAS